MCANSADTFMGPLLLSLSLAFSLCVRVFASVIPGPLLLGICFFSARAAAGGDGVGVGNLFLFFECRSSPVRSGLCVLHV